MTKDWLRACDDCNHYVPFSSLVERELSETESERVCQDRERCKERGGSGDPV